VDKGQVIATFACLVTNSNKGQPTELIQNV